MRKGRNQNRNGVRAEYDFASMDGGVRGKHYLQYRKGSNVVQLEPDVADAFPTEDAVNEALRGILTTTRAIRRIGGLPDSSLKPAPSAPRRRARRD